MPVDSFVRSYWNLQVSATHPRSGMVNCTISCNKYLINVGANDASDYAQRVHTKQGHIGQVMSAGQSARLLVNAGAFGRVRVGKGSPDDMAHVLNIGVGSGALAGDQAQIQQWADANLGVDCTGFASNYFLSSIQSTSASVTNIGCNFFRRQAIDNNSTDQAFIWDFDAVQADDVLLWMNEAGIETRHPGHIAVVYDTNREAGNRVLYLGESSGESDNQGHWGPRLSTRLWQDVDPQTRPGNRKLSMYSGTVIVRPFPSFSDDGGGPTAIA